MARRGLDGERWPRHSLAHRRSGRRYPMVLVRTGHSLTVVGAAARAELSATAKKHNGRVFRPMRRCGIYALGATWGALLLLAACGGGGGGGGSSSSSSRSSTSTSTSAGFNAAVAGIDNP